mmetsp:Transcript_41255/g.30331  ORF Transcript_41255/g.30331 Transcript_41255/m.30331 type:complete len:187 (+) Transcript_41255:130-690(+)|eukprot:CAMPEP_0202971744 /NCGR_PEP_ID=MMETSP1396-20130829/30399_1 /ASSEMBLY_ACC=CAM_ASM_000872 /TAXON_ID= /ORGANISM="Pseudokeronopsis sp., Strain Brazil" /LENGTH=186 /DNA_ID=CAMNT_0049701457 /DNA_START=137 /DNA_END=697 /DNA_ORIENTATION=+
MQALLIALRILFYVDDRKEEVSVSTGGTVVIDNSEEEKQVLVSIIFMTPVQVFFCVIFLLAELKKPQVLKYFNFIQHRRARGAFLILIAVTYLDGVAGKRFIALIIDLVLIAIGFIDLIVGQTSQEVVLKVSLESKNKQKKKEEPKREPYVANIANFAQNAQYANQAENNFDHYANNYAHAGPKDE